MPDRQATTSRYKTREANNVWSEEERAAMQASARERKATSKRSLDEERAEGLRDLEASIARMAADERAMAERIHGLVTAAAPSLVSKTYYGMPAYARAGKQGKVICFFKNKSKFKVRYSTLGFQPDANLDDGEMWPTEFAVIDLTPGVEARISDLVRRAAG
jgi:uncharacterized protein YdhG (YjbR/CyaY superfamily)